MENQLKEKENCQNQEIDQHQEIVEAPTEINDKDELDSLKNQIKVLEDKLLRMMAESENMRRRYEKKVEETKDYSIYNFAKDLIGVMDNLLRALEHKPEELDGQMTNLIAGVDMTKNELTSVFKKHGLESIEPNIGEKFDYNLHHVISQIVTEEYDQDSIVNTMQKGYKLKDRLLRPAIVTVSKKAALDG